MNFQAQYNYTQNDVNGNLKGSVATGIPVGTIAGANAAACVQSAVGTNPPAEIVIQEAPYQNTISPVCLMQQSGPVSLAPRCFGNCLL